MIRMAQLIRLHITKAILGLSLLHLGSLVLVVGQGCEISLSSWFDEKIIKVIFCIGETQHQ